MFHTHRETSFDSKYGEMVWFGIVIQNNFKLPISNNDADDDEFKDPNRT